MNIGIVCYASIGGSGIIATELGKRLVARGHLVHVLSSDMPVRLGLFQPGLSFHRVETPSYPLFREPQYLLSLASKIVQVARAERLDIVHAHYAIPHATAAYLARQILASTRDACVPRVITTLHGTDITLLGADRSYSETVRFSIDQSDGVTAVSNSLKSDTLRELGVTRDIRVIPNFIDCSVYRRSEVLGVRERLAPGGEHVVVHVSNFRPVKRVTTVIDVFARVRSKVPAKLLMIGDGPDMGEAAKLAHALGIQHDVEFLGEQGQVVPILSVADAFLLPSEQESFGLAALEAMACGVPVVASKVGGLPEVIQDGVTGFLHPLGDLEGMAASTLKLLTDRSMRDRMAEAARGSATGQFCDDRIVPQYERYYEEILGGNKTFVKSAT
ncbi:MAG TPA: N-acetyl-alpha-D-glucosaminyl L-malate synthase BshA [Vicinamibacterales bacterium]|jgi:N-acetyl-alpha-D-glucosaminyl L-malate synthase BshA|nr:N-acetyl-alpha-D-glucosaminyl L-malate synthase BshA [Vicinamibacterales bacterium]